MNNAYYSPDYFGLTMIDSIEWSEESYSFDLTGIWRHDETEVVYFADDSGCSCPSPFEGMTSLDDFTRADKMQVLIDHLDERRLRAISWRGEDSAFDGRLQQEIAGAVRAAFL